jgi:hypothetical protein
MVIDDALVVPLATAAGAAFAWALKTVLDVARFRRDDARANAESDNRRSAAMTDQFQALLDELRSARTEDRVQLEALQHEVLHLNELVRVLTEHVVSLEDALRKHGHETPPRPVMGPRLSPIRPATKVMT